MEEIIIDSVNVSECGYFMKHNLMPMCRACNSGYGSPYCEYHNDCYYKELKRKETECETYKKMIEDFRRDYEWTLGNKFKLEQALEKIKKIVKEKIEYNKENCIYICAYEDILNIIKEYEE